MFAANKEFRKELMRLRHEPVLLHEVISVLHLRSGEVVVDGTLGSAGHAEAILEATQPTGLLIGLDQDAFAIERSAQNLKRFEQRVILRQENFRRLDVVLNHIKISGVDAVLLDIGISLEQLSDEARGFSFRSDGPLDMRMDERGETRASDLIEHLSEEELSGIFFEYGEERQARRFARAIVERRVREPIRTSSELADLVFRKAPVKQRYGRIHPATRVFQSLRIAVNDELGALKEGLGKAMEALKPEGRLAVITFHSLEDRIVKHAFRDVCQAGKAVSLTKKPLMVSENERNRNPKSRSAKLRAIRWLG